VTGLGAATLILIVLLLPGAMCSWMFERLAGRFGIGLKDRALRFMGVSAVLLAFAAWPLYWVYTNYWDAFVRRETLPWWFWGLPILYIFVPLAAGSLPGLGWKRNWRWARFIVGRDRAPSAWDHLFQDQPTGGIRCKLKSGMWIAGLYAETSEGTRPFASGYPDPQDLYLPAILRIDTESGELVLDANGQAEVLDQGALLRWRDIEYLEFVPTE